MQTEQQKENLRQATIQGYFKNLVEAQRGTGELRRELTTKEKAKRKKTKQIVKASRKKNR